MQNVIILHINSDHLVRWRKSEQRYHTILRGLVSLYTYAATASHCPHSVLALKGEKAKHQMRNIIKAKINMMGVVLSYSFFAYLPNEMKELIAEEYLNLIKIFDHYIDRRGVIIVPVKLKLDQIWMFRHSITAVNANIIKSDHPERVVKDNKCAIEGCICPPIQSTYDMHFYCSIHLPSYARWISHVYFCPSRRLIL